MNDHLFAGVSASSVGTGIANAMYLVAEAQQIDGPEAWAHFCLTAATEAEADVLANPPLEPDETSQAERQLDGWLNTDDAEDRRPITGEALQRAAHLAGATAFRCCMPKLTNRRSIQSFIACAMVGQLHGYLTGKDTNALLYGAQQALSAYPKRKASKGRK